MPPEGAEAARSPAPEPEWNLDARSPVRGVRRFTVPLAFPSPDHLHVHLLDTPEGVLMVDCGAVGSEAALQAGLANLEVEPDDVLVTHGHMDHWGLATTLTDRILAHRGVLSTFDFIRASEGFTGEITDERRKMAAAFGDMLSMMSGIPEITEIGEGDRFGDWEVLYTPGHDLGHVCLFRESDGVLLCGDVLLPGYTPNVQPAADGSDALADFMASIERLGALPVSLVLPAHGEPYADAAGRARELIAHHERRLDTLRAAMRDGRHTLRELRNLTFSLKASERGDRMLAAMETWAHLDHLRRIGEARLEGEDHWSLIT